MKAIAEEIINHVVKYAKKKEILIGIDPNSTLGRDILRQNAEIMELKSEIAKLKKMTVDMNNRLDKLFLTNKTTHDLHRLSAGGSTLNQIRNEYELNPVEDTSAEIIFTKV